MTALKKEGKKLLGCFPLYPPVELFHSMDLEPVIMWGLKPFFPATPKSNQHLQNFVCSIGRHLTEFVLSEAGELLDGLFMYNACDTLRNLPEILRSGLEDRNRQLPLLNIHVPMPPLRQTDGGQYLRNEMDVLIEEVETVFETRFMEGRFLESVCLYRKARLLALQLEKAVEEGRIGFNLFANLLHGNYFRSVEKQIDPMESALAGINLENQTGNASGRRVVLSGILPPPAGVVEIIEEAGMKVVGNDIASLARSYSYTPETTGSPLDYYVDFYYTHPPCPTLLGSSDNRPGAGRPLSRPKR